MNKGMDKRDTLFVKMKTLCKIVFFFFCVFSSIRKNESFFKKYFL